LFLFFFYADRCNCVKQNHTVLFINDTLFVEEFIQSIKNSVNKKRFNAILNLLELSERFLISVGRLLKILIPE